MPRSKSSKRWLKEHFSDTYVKQAQEEGYRSRATYKLLEIQQKDQIIKPGMTIVDLGAAPGGWSQAAAKLLKGKGKIVALDILPMKAIPNVHFIQGDFTQTAILNQLHDELGGEPVDVILSDMSPNLSGIKAVDQAKAMYLSELALAFAKQVLKPNGSFVVKVFQGSGFDDYLKTMRKLFNKVAIRKPKSSRSRSPELYLLGKGFR
ncbi:MAG: 23S rRNA (uridine(2552)-2'-O)-methyltransferase RlmE [Gammaproteobacteria bacterium]|nr:23S rRNA (uridine(2552)-2'-O)-methyltransferase RlmE [Gammaproteobacteria bacterium]